MIDQAKVAENRAAYEQARAHALDLLAGLEKSLEWHRAHGVGDVVDRQYLIKVRRPRKRRDTRTIRLFPGVKGEVMGSQWVHDDEGRYDPNHIDLLVIVPTVPFLEKLRKHLAKLDKEIAWLDQLTHVESISVSPETTTPSSSIVTVRPTAEASPGFSSEEWARLNCEPS